MTLPASAYHWQCHRCQQTFGSWAAAERHARTHRHHRIIYVLAAMVALTVALVSCTTTTTAQTCGHRWSAALAATRGDIPAALDLYAARLGPAQTARCADAGG
jgi:hypothetical protein